MSTQKIEIGDCREIIKKYPDNFFDCLVTSPPYWGLRDYKTKPIIFDGLPECEHEFSIEKEPLHNGHGDAQKSGKFSEQEDVPDIIIENGFCSICGAWRGQLGLEPTPELFISHLLDIFTIIEPKIKSTGSIWINLGDSYYGSPRNSKNSNLGNSDALGQVGGITRHAHRILKPKSLCMIPSRFAWGMIERGWILRNEIIFYKPNHMPESVTDRLTKTHEMMYHFVKNRNYFYDLDAIRDPHKPQSLERYQRAVNLGSFAVDTKYGDRSLMGVPTQPPKWFTGANTGVNNKIPYKDNNPHRTRLYGGKFDGITNNLIGKNPSDFISINEKHIDFNAFPIQTHTITLTPQIFKNLSTLVGIIINKLKNLTTTMGFNLSNPNITPNREFISNLFHQFISTTPMQPNFVIFNRSPYATITIEQSPNKISIEFGRNRWIFFNEGFPLDDVINTQSICHSFAINSQSIGIPFFFMINWMRGTKLCSDIINEFVVYRSKLNCGVRVGFVFGDTSIGSDESQNIGNIGIGNNFEIFMIETMLCVALDNIGVSMSLPPMIVCSTKTSTDGSSITIENTTFNHIIPLSYFNFIGNKSGDVWIINTQSYHGAHFATFPLSLVRIPILATCPTHICKKCSKPRERIMETITIDRTVSDGKGNGELADGGFGSSIQRQSGWSDCGCGAECEPGWVLDPFAGSGTTLEFCRENNKNAVGIELNENYRQLAVKRARLDEPPIKPMKIQRMEIL